jgi:hypothetical protein
MRLGLALIEAYPEAVVGAEGEDPIMVAVAVIKIDVKFRNGEMGCFFRFRKKFRVESHVTHFV